MPISAGFHGGHGPKAHSQAPSARSLPVVTATPLVGTPATYTPGAYVGQPIPTVTRQWLLDGSPIGGATGTTYTPTAGQEGAGRLSVRETATNAIGSVQGTSASSAVNRAPSFSAAPVIVGTPMVGVPTAIVQGTVVGHPAPTVTRLWLLDGGPIAFATGATYTPVAGDVGAGRLSVRETAANALGAATSTSAVATVLPAAVPSGGALYEESYKVYAGVRAPLSAGPAVPGLRPTRYSQILEIHWRNRNGDFTNSLGVEQATASPWHTLSVPGSSPAGYRSFSITALAQHWQVTGENKGGFLIQSAGSVTLGGTFNVDPLQRPKLDVVTAQGSWTFDVDLAAFNNATGGDLLSPVYVSYLHTGVSNPSTPSYVDPSQGFQLTTSRRALFHADTLLDTVLGAITSATLRLYVQSSSTAASTINVYEPDVDRLKVAGNYKTPTFGLAAEVGETNLPAHADVIAAGDFREANWSGNPGVRRSDAAVATANRPGAVFNHCAMDPDQYDLTTVVADPDFPGSFYMRTGIPVGNIGGGEIAVRFHTPDLTDPLRPPKAADLLEEAYARVYAYYEPATFWSDHYGFKNGNGFDLRYGMWDDAENQWIMAAGSGQTDSNGRKFKWFRQSQSLDPLLQGAQEGDIWEKEEQPTAAPNTRTFRLQSGAWGAYAKYNVISNRRAPLNRPVWVYEGHSIRGHLGADANKDYTKYPNHFGVNFAPSHLGPYNLLWDSAVFGTEQTIRIGDHVIPRGRWVCIETYVKVNSVDMTNADAYGNGAPRNDGILRVWLDGVLAGERTNFAWRCSEDVGVQANWLMTYHGGGTPTNHEIYWRYNHFAMAKRYIGPIPSRTYPAGVDYPRPAPASGGSLTALRAAIGFDASPTNRWLNTGIRQGTNTWAIRSMVPGAKDATQAEVEPGPADVGAFSTPASDTLVNSNGIAWNDEKKQAYFWGGGHGGWPGNEVYCDDFSNRVSIRVTDPSPMDRNKYGSASGYGWRTLDGSPVSCHTYGGIFTVPGRNGFYTLFGSPWPDGNFPNSDLWFFDLAARTWTKVLSNAFAPVNEFRGSVAHYIPTSWYAGGNRVALGQPSSWRWFDPYAAAGSQLGPINGSGQALSNGHSVATPQGIYSFHGVGAISGEVFFIPYADIGVTRATQVTAATHPRIFGHPRWQDAAHQWNSYLWDPVRQKVISWSGSRTSEPSRGGTNSLANAIIRKCGRYVYAIDFANDHLYEFVVPDGAFFPVSESLGSFSKWQYLSDLDAYLGLNNRAINNGWSIFKPGTLTLLA